MNWEALSPPVDNGKGSYGTRDASPVMMSVTRQGRSSIYRLVVCCYPQKLDHELSWWKVGTTVTVRMGRGDCGGQLQIVADPNGPFVLSRVGSHPNAPCGVKLELPKHLPKATRPREAVEFELGNDSIQLALPRWVLPRGNC